MIHIIVLMVRVIALQSIMRLMVQIVMFNGPYNILLMIYAITLMIHNGVSGPHNIVFMIYIIVLMIHNDVSGPNNIVFMLHIVLLMVRVI